LARVTDDHLLKAMGQAGQGEHHGHDGRAHTRAATRSPGGAAGCRRLAVGQRGPDLPVALTLLDLVRISSRTASAVLASDSAADNPRHVGQRTSLAIRCTR